MKKTFAAVLLAAFIPASALAMGFGSSSDDATYEMGFEKAMAGDYEDAIDVLKQVVKETPDNADAWNMLGFSYRNSGDSDNAWDAYERALAIDPNHKGAHEYIGEWYLMQGDVASAKAQLEKLQTLCPSGCEEAETLTSSISKAENS